MTPKATAPTGYSGEVSYFASKFKQGNRTVYSFDIPLGLLSNLVPRPDHTKPTVGNRAIRLKHAQEFGKYLRQRDDWVAPSLILRAGNVFKFAKIDDLDGAEFGTLSFNNASGKKIHILDGQHRILGTYLAFDAIEDERTKAAEREITARVNGKVDAADGFRKQMAALDKETKRLANERISVQIYVVDDPVAFQQMFFDIAENALGMAASVKTRFDNRKVVNRAMLSTLEHPLLTDRIDGERDWITKDSTALMTAKHVAEIIRVCNVGIDGRVSKIQEATVSEDIFADKAKRFLTVLTDTMPGLRGIIDGSVPPQQLRKESLLGSVLFMRILAGVWYELTQIRGWDDQQVKEFFALLAPHTDGPAYDGSVWRVLAEDYFDEDSYAPHGRRQDIKALVNEMVGWSLSPEAREVLQKPPAERPLTMDEFDLAEAQGYLKEHGTLL